MSEEETKQIIARILREGLAVLLKDKSVTVEQYQLAKQFVEDTVKEFES